MAKYLKPFLIGLVLSIALLFGQAICDLSLPNYMSDIVNVGLQQSGIEHAAPDAVSEEGMSFIMAFMSDGQRPVVEHNYALVSSASMGADGKTYKERYPNAGEKLYIKLGGDDYQLATLDSVFGETIWTFINVMKQVAEQSGQTTDSAGTEALKDIDIAQMYAFTPMLSMLPQASIDAARDQALEMDASLRAQSGVMLAKAFYTELGADIGAMQTAYILRIGLMMLLIALLGGVATVLVSYISSRVAAGVARNLRKDVFAKIESFTNEEFDRFSTASLITRCTNDVMQIQMLLMMGIRMICYAPIMGVGGVIMAVGKSASMSWIIAAACVALLGLISVVMSIALPKFKAIQKLVDRLNLVSRESLSGLMVIRAFGTQEHEKQRFDTANQNLTKTNLFVNRVMVFMMPTMMLIMNGVTLLIVWVGARQISSAAMQVGDMMAFMQYAMQIIMSFLMISMMFIFVPRAAVSADRIAEVLGAEPTIRDPEQPKPLDPAMKGVVQFKDVHFRYHGAQEDTLSDISFTAMPGETTAIIGSTGSGKSTVVNLIMRFYDATEGQVLVDGVDVRDVAQRDLRGRIGYVPQKGTLLTGTIASNISYGNPDATDDDIETAADVAQAMEFINERPERFDSDIAQGGANVSGGQKQRLSIARALAIKPEVFIFDDSFSALDFKTDAVLRRRLKEHTGQSTVIVIAQRVSTIMNADMILVLDEGRVVGRGTHKELLKSCAQYYEIASSQLSKEELA